MALSDYPIQGPIDHTPDPFQKDFKLRISRNNKKKRIEIATSRDRGVTQKVLLPEVTQSVRVGSVPMVTESGDVEWLPLPTPTITAGSPGAGIFYAEFLFPGELQLNRVFGNYYAPGTTAVRCIGMQIDSFVPSTGSDIKVDIVNSSNVEQLKIGTLSAGSEYTQIFFASPLAMPAESRWRLKIKQIGSTTPGDTLRVRLLLTT